MKVHPMKLAAPMLFLIANCCATLGASAEPASADLVVINGKILTLSSQVPAAEAAAVRDGRFVLVGSTAEVKKLIGEDTRVLDAEGRRVIPGLIETHVHATGASRGEVSQPFVQLRSIEEIQNWVRERVKTAKTGEWIRLPRVDVTRIREGRLPTREDLDAAADEHPVLFHWQYANRVVQILNSAALRAAEITADTKAPHGGLVQLGPDGQPTGRLENASELTARFLPRVDVSERQHLDSLESLLRRYNSLGITSIFERNTNADGYRLYDKLKQQGRLPLRVTTTIGLRTDGTVEGTQRAIQALPLKPREGDDWLRVGPLKIGVDGGVLYGTAFLREPYGASAFNLYGFNDPAYRGNLRISPEELKNIIRTGHRMGWQMSAHVTGDAGVDAVLDAVEAANQDSPIADDRYTLIHAYFANPDTAERAARLGVCVDTQPAWYYKDGDALAAALGGQRLREFIGLQTWRDAGVKVAINSDHMQGFDPTLSLNPYHPFLTMYTAVTRKTESGQVIGVEQRVSREAALRMMTIDAAYLSFDEHHRGSIEQGKLADFAVLSDDLLTCQAEQLKEIRSVATVVGGHVVHEQK